MWLRQSHCKESKIKKFKLLNQLFSILKLSSLELFQRLDVEGLKALGVAPGPIYKKIKSGENVSLENGNIV